MVGADEAFGRGTTMPQVAKTDMSWKTILLFAIGIGVGLGVIFGVLNIVFGISLPSWVIGAVCGVIIGLVIGHKSRRRGA